LSNNPFDADETGEAFGTFENGGLESTEIDRDFGGDVFGRSAMDGLGPFGSGVDNGNDPFAVEAFGSFGSGVDTGNDPFASDFLGEDAFGAGALDASTKDSQTGSNVVDDEQAIENSSRGSQHDIPAAESTSSFINVFGASPLASASIQGDDTTGLDDVFGNNEFDASFTNGEGGFKSRGFGNGSFDEKFANDDAITIDASFVAEGFGAFPAESQIFVESDDGGGAKSQTAGPLETTHLEGSFASGSPQREESQSSNENESSRGSQSGAIGESRSFAEGEGSYHSSEQSHHSSESRSSEEDNNSFGPQHDESRGSGDSKSEGKHQIEQSRRSRGSEYTDQDSTPSFREDGIFEASGNAPQHDLTVNDQDNQSSSFHSDSRSQGKISDGSTTEDRSVEVTSSVHSEGNLQDSFETGSQSDEKSFYSDDDQSQKASVKDDPQQDEESAYSQDTNEAGTKLSAGPSEHSREVEDDEETEDKGENSFDSGSYESSGPSFAEDESGHVSDVDDQARSNAPDIDPTQPDDNELGNGVVEDDDESIGIGDVFGQPNELFEQHSTSEKGEGHRTRSQRTRRESIDKRDDSSPQGSVKNETSASDNAQGSLVKLEPKPKLYPKPKDKEDPEERRKRKKRKKKLQKAAKSDALLALVSNVNEAMLELEAIEAEQPDFEETSAHRLLHGFDALLGIYLQLSDELELLSTFAQSKKRKEREAMVPLQALKAVLSFAATLDELFADLQPIILDCFEEDPDEEMDDMLYRLNSLVDLLCETTHRVGERQEWNERAETTYVTLLELMEREATELISYFEDVETPEQILSANIHEAWSATGHIEELRALQYASDPWLFRQLCYEVMVSTDQWCPDTTILMEICGIDPSLLEEEPDSEYLAEEELAPIPQAAEHVLDKVNGEPLSRTTTLASILRRILPPRAITDATLLDNFTSIRNTVRNPLGLSATNIVSISSIPEQPNDPGSLGVGGMGKTTLAAMVAQHPDVRRYFIDGVVWVYVGDKELNYNRYTQCLRELVAQLDFYQGVPLFAELLHVPGEALSKRRRREEGFMIYARDTIAEILHDRSVLIILDDVCFEPDLDWFDFAPMPGEENDQLDSNCALLVTTRCRTLLPAADTVEVDMLDEADAISLLIQESGQLSHTLMAQSREARSVVRECANHPLAVKSVGRWLHLKHATAGVVSSVEEIHSEVIKSMDKILKGGDHTGTDMMYEILSMSLSPAINGEPTSIIKFCLAAFVIVFCDREYISDFALTEPTPIIPMDMAELLFETLLEMNESSLLQKGSLFYAQKKEAAVLIPEALSALGVLKVITYSDAEENEEPEDEQKFLQVMHFIHHEYGEYLCGEEEALKDLTKDAERQWNRALVEAYLSQVEEWDRDLEDAGHSYALEMIVSHMIRGGMSSAAADLLADKSFVRGRLLSLGRENATRRQIKDCEALFKKLKERRQKGSKLEPRTMMKQAYQALGSQLALDDEDSMVDSRIKDVEVARAHYEIGFSLAEKRCWDAAIAHWETSQGILVAALGTVEIVAGILFNIGVVYSEMNEYEQALDSLKQCLRIRGTIHGEEHILYAQTIQKIGDIFLGMSDYHEALESYNWALDVMYIDPNIHRVEIGEILDNKGTIHYSKGEIDEALQCHQEALRSKQFELGEDHPELASTYHHIGNCLSDQGNVDDAVVHFEEAIRLKELDPEGGPERDADVLTIEGILHNLEGNQDQGLECYEKSLQILVTKVPYRKEKVASLLHLIGCVYLMSGEQKKAMKLFEESLQARRKVLGFVHLDVASTLFNMAFLHQTRNRLDKALKCLEEALKIRQLRLPDSEKVAVTHEKIGSLARAIGKTKKAQINFEDALRIRRLIHGEQHEAVATVLQELGDLMDDLSEYDSAMSYYIDALDIRRNRLGLDDIAVAETLYSMGYTLHNNDEPDRALVCFEESLNIRRYQLGDDSKEVGDTLNMIGFLKAKRGELDDALTLLWDALRIRKIQEDHVKVSETLKNIGNVHREKKERDLAVECYEECLRIRRTELGPEHEKVADALIAMGNVQSDMDHKDDAMRSYQEALKIRTMLFGEHDEGVAAVLQYMGTMEFRSGNHDRARDLLTEFVRIRRDNGTKHDGDYVNVLFIIGNIHKMHNHEEDAQLCWSEAYQVFQELGLAETNPQIAKVMNHLLKAEEEKEEADKKKAKGAGVFGKVTEKLKVNPKEEKLPGKKRRKGKGIQL
jgi:tetratricopeptide (TPR) repeat protein